MGRLLNIVENHDGELMRVRIGGREYTVRNPTIGDMDFLTRRMGEPGVTFQELQEGIGRLFIGERPDISRWDSDSLYQFVMSVGDAYGRQLARMHAKVSGVFVRDGKRRVRR